MTNRRILTAVVGILALASALVGCAGISSPTNSEASAQLKPMDSYGREMKACLKEAGFDATAYDDGSVGISLPEEQMPAYDAATAACTAQLGYDQSAKLTESQMADLYQKTLDLVDCLENQGFRITDVPTEQTFIDGTPFVPYEQVPMSVVGDEWNNLIEACPQPLVG